MNKYKVLIITNDVNGYYTILKEFELLVTDIDMATDITQAYVDRFFKDANLYILIRSKHHERIYSRVLRQ